VEKRKVKMGSVVRCLGGGWLGAGMGLDDRLKKPGVSHIEGAALVCKMGAVAKFGLC
jgi:hypothetical protein